MSKSSKSNDDQTTYKAPRANSPASAIPRKAGNSSGKGTRVAALAKGDDWSEVANFVVTFERRESEAAGTVEQRISAHKMQDGGITAIWSGVGQQPMCEWIANHVGDWASMDADKHETDAVSQEVILAPSLASTPSDGDAAAISSDVTVTISDLRTLAASADAQTLGAGKLDRTSFASGEAFNVETRIEISGLRGRDLHRNSPCCVKFFSRNIATRLGLQLGQVSVDDLAEGQTSYRAVLPRVSLPAGSYRLETVALLKGTQTKMAYRQGPLLQVL